MVTLAIFLYDGIRYFTVVTLQQITKTMNYDVHIMVDPKYRNSNRTVGASSDVCIGMGGKNECY